ncbi:unnamed protein product [Protopolystoma xenopodis]|uniref:Uncharacterized protein n=1 Tax=Protopolystoma xenopodis TaxID=117903 RepID=A0A448XKW3_9PLAT|nr:unnamed protein product [Protopolystoma xenopodis]
MGLLSSFAPRSAKFGWMNGHSELVAHLPLGGGLGQVIASIGSRVGCFVFSIASTDKHSWLRYRAVSVAPSMTQTFRSVQRLKKKSNLSALGLPRRRRSASGSRFSSRRSPNMSEGTLIIQCCFYDFDSLPSCLASVCNPSCVWCHTSLRPS